MLNQNPYIIIHWKTRLLTLKQKYNIGKPWSSSISEQKSRVSDIEKIKVAFQSQVILIRKTTWYMKHINTIPIKDK